MFVEQYLTQTSWPPHNTKATDFTPPHTNRQYYYLVAGKHQNKKLKHPISIFKTILSKSEISIWRQEGLFLE